jgi:hypothetical protein
MPDLATFTLPGTSTDGRTSIATKIGAVYVFLLFCRLLELLAFFGFGGLRLMLVMTLVALVAVVLTGNFGSCSPRPSRHSPRQLYRLDDRLHAV